MSDLGRAVLGSYTMVEDVRQFMNSVSSEKVECASLELVDLNQKARADAGNAIDQYLLGKSALRAGNLQKAEYYFAILANQQIAKAEYQLGLIYKEIYKDSAGALCCFKRAAQKGYAKAQFTMGMLVKEAKPTHAFVYFKAAADQSHALAQFYTALCFKYGRGVVADKEAAAFYSNKVACEGFKEKSIFVKVCEVLAKSNMNLMQAMEAETDLWHAV
jgi:TPR repeat protein